MCRTWSPTGTDLPIIFISGHFDLSTTVRAMKAGALEFMTIVNMAAKLGQVN